MEYCVCKHPQWCHLPKSCAVCTELWEEACAAFHTFKLDNLKYIEDLAKERGLV